MLKVVSNTTPILSLLKIDKLELLKSLYGSIFISEAVFREIEAGKNKEYYINLKEINWITIEAVNSLSSRSYLFDLDDGEAETLILAQEKQANLVIIDEKCGRRYAQILNIPLTGTIGVLLKAKEKGLIGAICPFLKDLCAKQSWINPDLMEKALSMAGEEWQKR
jgi:predicted nucleic acid-binding protein